MYCMHAYLPTYNKLHVRVYICTYVHVTIACPIMPHLASGNDVFQCPGVVLGVKEQEASVDQDLGTHLWETGRRRRRRS